MKLNIHRIVALVPCAGASAGPELKAGRAVRTAARPQPKRFGVRRLVGAFGRRDSSRQPGRRVAREESGDKSPHSRIVVGRDDFSLCYQPSSSSRQSAFTMVEIALCLAIIGFALVAIIGVMPSGMTVQRDNRIDSLINQDAQFWLNAIRSGGGDVVDLTEHVSTVDGVANVNNNTLTSSQIIGLLSQPFTNNKARVRAIAGSAAERDPSVLGFDYILFTQIYPFTNSPINSPARLATNFLYEVRLTFRWPVLPEATGDNFGNGKKVFRALVSGQLTKSGNLFFFQTKSFEQP